jgi:endoglucanase
MRPALTIAAIAACLAAAACGGGSSTDSSADGGGGAGATAEAAARPARGLHVDGNRLLDRRGRQVRFHGVNRSGTEYACVQGWGIFDGPHDEASVEAIASWGVNAVRVPINETCWLAINGVEPRYSGDNYRRAIVRYVRLLQRHGIYAEISLMWAAPGRYQATYQPNAPNRDHSPSLWRSLAATFKRHRNVVLAPWGETTVNARCFLRGGGAECGATYGPSNAPYAIVGMQRAVDVMRAAGYKGVIAIPGVDYANDLSQWLSHRPQDPRGQLIAEAHIYGTNTCGSIGCLERTVAPVARRVPVIFGEAGESHDDSQCDGSFVARAMRWADRHRVGYLAWTWNTWGTCGSLIRNFSGAPRGAYGETVRRRFAATRAVARLIPGR